MEVINCIFQYKSQNLSETCNRKAKHQVGCVHSKYSWRFKNSNRNYLSYLFDLSVMLMCIQSHCHLSKKPIVTLLTVATWYLKCANLTELDAESILKCHSYIWLHLFLTVNIIIILQSLWLKTNMIPISVWKRYMKGNTGMQYFYKFRRKESQ